MQKHAKMRNRFCMLLFFYNIYGFVTIAFQKCIGYNIVAEDIQTGEVK